MRVPSTGWSFHGNIKRHSNKSWNHVCLLTQTIYQYFHRPFKGTWDRGANKSAALLLLWSWCLCYTLPVSKGSAVTVQLWWLHHISCFIWIFLTHMEQGSKRSAGLLVNLHWYSMWWLQGHIWLDRTISIFHFDFHFSTSTLIWSLWIQQFWKSPCFSTSAARMYTQYNPYCHGSLAVTMSGEVNKNLLGSPGCE